MLILSDDVENNGFPIVNFMLILINFVVFVWVLGQGSQIAPLYSEWGTVPARFVGNHNLHDFLAIGSSMFLHAGVLHLLGNMWILFLFGDNVEDRLGSFTYLVFYICCGLFADLLHVLSDPTSMVPAVGASGAIAGVMGAYIAMHPDAKCKTWWGDDFFFLSLRTYQIPALIVCGTWFLLQFVVGAMLPAQISGVAVWAHVGGFLAGIGLLTFIRYEHYQGVPGWGRGATISALAMFIALANYMFSDYSKAQSKTTFINVTSESSKSGTRTTKAKSDSKAKSTSKANSPAKSKSPSKAISASKSKPPSKTKSPSDTKSASKSKAKVALN